MTEEILRFWLVWCPDGKKPPKFEHPTQTSAEKEAVRLADKTGLEFYVLEAIGRAVRIDGRVKYSSNVPDETERQDLT